MKSVVINIYQFLLILLIRLPEFDSGDVDAIPLGNTYVRSIAELMAKTLLMYDKLWT